MYGVLHRVYGLALDGLDADLVELVNEQLAVFGIHDGLHGGTEHLDIIFLEHARAVELDAAVEGGLAVPWR